MVYAHKLAIYCAALLSLSLTDTTARAVDGVREINQDCALAGCFAGDGPGYPVTISESGSYRLTSNLDVTGLIFGIRGVEVMTAVDRVSIDLGGFVIDGSAAANPGSGIVARDRAVVEHGVIRNFDASCLLVGDESRVDDVRTEGCQIGIATGNYSQVLRSSARGHSNSGVSTGIASRIESCVATNNFLTGLRTQAIGLVSKSSADLTASGTGIVSALVIESASTANLFGVSLSVQGVASGNTVGSNSSSGFVSSAESVLVGNVSSGNGLFGYTLGEHSVVRRNIGSDNGSSGMTPGNGSAVVHNTASDNTGHGIDCALGGFAPVCGMVGNTATSNDLSGLRLALTGAIQGTFKDNTLNQNTLDVSLFGFDPGFQNSCSGNVPCP